MGLKTRDDYLAALREMRPNIYKFGELIEGVATSPLNRVTLCTTFCPNPRSYPAYACGASKWPHRTVARRRCLLFAHLSCCLI